MAGLHVSTNCCRACNTEKPISEFYTTKNRYGVVYAANKCKACCISQVKARANSPERIDAVREWRRKNKEKIRRAEGARPIQEVRATAEARRKAKQAKAEANAHKTLSRYYSAHVARWRLIVRAREKYRKLAQDPEYRAMKAAKKRERMANNADAKKRANEYMKAWFKTPAGQKSKKNWAQSPAGKEARRRGERKRTSTPKGILDDRIGRAIRVSLRGGKNGVSWQKLVGYTLDDLKAHIERQFPKGMGWHNRRKWHIDHIIPKSSFSYRSPDDEDFKACWALTNLRPLWADENVRKSDRRLTLL